MMNDPLWSVKVCNVKQLGSLIGTSLFSPTGHGVFIDVGLTNTQTKDGLSIAIHNT